jgi:hypothetical protein
MQRAIAHEKRSARRARGCAAYLADNDAYHFFIAVRHDHHQTNGTNVNDLFIW